MQEILMGCAGALGGSVGVAYLLNAPLRTVIPSSLTALLGYVVFALLHKVGGQSLIFGYFAATLAVSIVCETLARTMRMPSTIFLLIALVPLVPGYDFYCMMLAIAENNGAAAASFGLQALQTVAAIAVGAAVTSVAFRSLMNLRILKG